MQISRFVKGKGQIIEEYQRAKRKVSSGVASRNFSYEPGFMYDMMNELEIDAKLKLSDLNYTILEPQEFVKWNEFVKKLNQSYAEVITFKKKYVIQDFPTNSFVFQSDVNKP